MQPESPMLVLVPFATGLLTSFVTIRLLSRYSSPTAPACTLLFAALSLWLFATALSLSMQDVHDRILAGKLIYPGVVAIPVAMLLLAARASRHDSWITPRTTAALWIVPCLSLLLAASNELHGWFWPSIRLAEDGSGGDRLVWAHGPAFWLNAVYAYGLLGAAALLMADKYRRNWQRYRSEGLLVMSGMSAPWLANALYLSGNSPFAGFDLTPYGFTVTAFLLALGLHREGILEAVPVSRSMLVQQLADGLLVLDSHFRLVDLNAAACEVLGLRVSAVRDLLAREALARHPALLELLESGEQDVSRVVSLGRDPAAQRSFDVRISALRESGRGPVGRLVVLRDVTDYLRASEAAKAAAVAKSQFLANMSHEIRTPMNGVLGLAEDLAQAQLPPDARELVEDIRRSGVSLLHVIDDILDFSKLEAGKLRIAPIAFEPRALAEDAARLLRAPAREAGISLGVAVEDDVPAWLHGDPGRIRQVLLNLLSNAVKFTKQGSVTLNVRPESEGEGVVRVLFEVVDTGIGIAPAALDNIFDAFTQADASTTRRFGGTGLGLAISRELVGCMRGALGVESAEGKGSRFWFVLPLPRCEAPKPMPPTARPTSRQRGGRAPRVLAAEDNAVNQRVLARLLQRLGCEVELVGNGREAVERVRDGRYDLVLMDCQMPVLDGFAATREIRALGGESARLPVVAVTAHALEGDRERCLEEGMDDYVSKPLRAADLQRVLSRFVP